jgi:hypothetical protein
MQNLKHNFDDNIAFICLKCNCYYSDLYLQAFDGPVEKDSKEGNISFINRVNPCISDEEALIKKALE